MTRKEFYGNKKQWMLLGVSVVLCGMWLLGLMLMMGGQFGVAAALLMFSGISMTMLPVLMKKARVKKQDELLLIPLIVE